MAKISTVIKVELDERLVEIITQAESTIELLRRELALFREVTVNECSHKGAYVASSSGRTHRVHCDSCGGVSVGTEPPFTEYSWETILTTAKNNMTPRKKVWA